MSHSLPYISASFYLQKAAAIAPAVIRVRFTYAPKASDTGSSVDATNPSNYSVTGSKLVEVTSVSRVESDPQSVDVFLNVPLTTGLWNITASGTIQAFDDNATLSSPNSVAFSVSATKTAGPINGGARSDSAADIIRKHLPPSFAGPAWDALIDGLALGDAVNWQNAQAAFDQLFVSTASGSHLDRRSSDSGIVRPAYVGMSDESFRQYTIRTSADKLTTHAILQVLETFYGSDAVRARMESGQTEPYRLEDSDSLFVGVDALRPVEIVFNKQDFAQIGAASAIEVAAALNRRFRELRFPAAASTKQDPATLKSRVVVYSESMGLGSRVTAFGGFANNSLQFPKALSVPLANGTVLSISSPSQGIARFSLNNSGEPVFSDLQPGDRVNVWGDGFHAQNRGVYTVVDARFEWNGSSWDQSFDIDNENAFVQGAAEIYDHDDLMFFRPVASSPSDQSGVIVSQTSEGIDIVLPATTSVVQRDHLTGAHFALGKRVEAQGVNVNPDGTVSITTTSSHFIAVGDSVEVLGVAPTTELPQKQGGTSSLTSYSPFSASDTFSYPQGFSAPAGATACGLVEGSLLVCGDSKKSVRLNVSSGVGANSGHYSLAWQAVADMPASVSHHTATQFPTGSGRVVVVGGKVAGSASAASHVYISDTNTWSTISGAGITARYAHTATKVADEFGNESLFVYGGKSGDSTLATGSYSYDGTAFSAVSSLSGDSGRFSHSAVCPSPSTVLVAGGSSLLDVLASSFLYNKTAGTKTTCGNMSVARKDFALATLPSGYVLAVGGLGRNLSNETANRAVAECEIWNPTSSSWSPAGRLRYARQHPVVALIDGCVYVSGGTDTSGAPVIATERYDTATGEWSVLSSLANGQADSMPIGDSVSGLLISFSVSGATVLTPRKTSSGTKTVRQTLRVVSVPTPTQMVLASPSNTYLSSTEGVVVGMGAEASTVAGAYLWNPYGDQAITSVESTLVSSVAAGQQYSRLMLSAKKALLFPDAPGYICINHGTDDVIGPIPYLGRVSDSELMIDYGFVFPKSVPEGSTVTLLAGKGAFVPSRPDLSNSCYLTASSSGRVIAQAAIESILAAGLGSELRIAVLYPGDKGLGNAGYGVTGQKISDKVAVWGGNDLDSELAQAREEE